MKICLGSGNNPMPIGEGWLNIDKWHPEAEPWDLNVTPWKIVLPVSVSPEFVSDLIPIPESSVDEINANHVLEHLDSLCDVMREMYRVCKNGAKIQINVPSPRHKNYWGDPTHVSPVTPEMMYLFSKKACAQVKAAGGANSPLADYFNVDFDIVHVEFNIDPSYQNWINDPGLQTMMNNYWDVIAEYRIELRVIKEPAE